METMQVDGTEYAIFSSRTDSSDAPDEGRICFGVPEGLRTDDGLFSSHLLCRRTAAKDISSDDIASRSGRQGKRCGRERQKRDIQVS